MDRISLLSDDLVLKILSLLPSKDAVTTSLLSKRWTSLWKLVPRLEYKDPSDDTEHWRAARFVDKFLLFHEAPVLETLLLTLSRNCLPIDIEAWINVAISRGVRKIYFAQYRSCSGPIRLPWSLYSCETLVILYLGQAVTVDVPLTICFRSLKTLLLGFVNFSSGEIIHRLLSGCPVLETLTVIPQRNGNVKTFTIQVPSLRRLEVVHLKSRSQLLGDDIDFVIKAPSLMSLTFVNEFTSLPSLVKMPNLVNANIKLGHGDCKKLLECLTTVKHLALCAKTPMDSYPTCVFNHLVSLKLCACSSDWCRLILKHTPILRVLRFEFGERLFPTFKKLGRCCRGYGDIQTQWKQPSSVPQCLISSLETVEWTGYKGVEIEKKVVIYLLENTRKLKTMAIVSLTSTELEEKHKMLLELAAIQRSSTECRLLFT